MKFLAKTGQLTQLPGETLIIGLINGKLASNGTSLDTSNNLDGLLTKLIKQNQQLKTPGANLLVHIATQTHLKANSILLINFGTAKKLSHDNFKNYFSKAMTQIKAHAFQQIAIALDDIFASVTPTEPQQLVLTMAEALQASNYLYNHYKTGNKKIDSLDKITVFTGEQYKKIISQAVKQANALVTGINLTMDLANCPPNVCTPEYLAQQAKSLAKKYASIKTKVLNETELKKIGANTILNVGKGSVNKPRLIIMEYNGAKQKTAKPIIFVGKGITFDTGGNNLKSFAGMQGMKYDMCGSATVFGVMKTAVELNLPLNIIGVVAAAENMPGGEAYKPEDIVTSLSGKTIEVLNTDAEGRLVLCDALTYVERYQPKAVIDIATLTGAMITSLGSVASGVFSNNDKLAEQIIQAGIHSRDKVWRMPIWAEYQQQLQSDYADLANLGGPKAGSITAACFLANFTENYPWAHIDIAGTATANAKKTQKATGRPVRLLVQYLLTQK